MIVLLHGYHNCPKQDDERAGELFDLGYQVYVPRAPHHGQVPERRDPLGSLKAEEVAAYGDEAMNVASGLGDEVSVLGLSGGGLVASYIAQYRADADLVVPVAAFLAPPSIPAPLTSAALNAIELLPPIDNRDPAPDEAVRGAFPHGASDTSIQGAAAYIRVGQTVLRSASEMAPKAGRIVTVINDADTTVSNALIEELAARWEATAPDRTQVRHLDASLGLLRPDHARPRRPEGRHRLPDAAGHPRRLLSEARSDASSYGPGASAKPATARRPPCPSGSGARRDRADPGRTPGLRRRTPRAGWRALDDDLGW